LAPPVVDRGRSWIDEQVLFFVSDGIMVARAEGGPAVPVVDPVAANILVPEWVAQIRAMLGERREHVEQSGR
jgi:hypothetical protein